jgi:ribosomal protein S18 acetylase RimI-like enzyme
MVSLSSAKITIICILIAMAIVLLAFFQSAGLGPVFTLIAFLSLAIIVYLLYRVSDRLIIALAGASLGDVPAPIRNEIKRYCDREHMPVPLVAVIGRQLPDVYVDGVGRRKKALLITAGAIGQLKESELCDTAIKELASAHKYRAFDMAAIKLIVTPLGHMNDMSLSQRYMQNGIGSAVHINEHTTIRKVEDKDLLNIYRKGIEAFHEPTEFIPLHRLAYLYRKPVGIHMIAEYDGQPTGFIIGHIKKSPGGIYGHIDIIAVDVRYRGKGIGTELTRSFMRALEGYGCLHCCLEVWEHNEVAIKLYEKAGFAMRAVFNDYYKKGQHAQVMCKKLKSGFP